MSDPAREHILVEEHEDKAEALRMCLQYLHREAIEGGHRFTADLIALAAESLRCQCGREAEFKLSSFNGGTRQ